MQARQLLLGVAIAGVLYASLFIALPWLTGASSRALVPGGMAGLQSDHSRIFLWRLAVEFVVQAPWLGIGPMHYAHYLNPKAAHPHSVYLQVAAEWGLPMLAGLLALAAWGVWRMATTIRECTNPERAAMGVGLFTTVTAIAIDGVFSGNFVMPVSQAWIAVAVGGAIGWTRSNGPFQSGVGRTSTRWRVGASFAVLALVSQAWLWWSVGPEVADLTAHLDQVGRDISKSFTACPRFWSNGWF